MTPLLGAALELQNFLSLQQWQFCIIGGIALLRWGEPRFTRDVDVTLLTGFGREDDFIAPILSSGYRGRIADAAAFARKNRVLLLESPQHIAIDIALAGLPFEATAVERASTSLNRVARYERVPPKTSSSRSCSLFAHGTSRMWRPSLFGSAAAWTGPTSSCSLARWRN